VEEKRQRLSVKVDGSIPRFVVGDDQRLAQVVTNLLSNAVKFTPEEGEIRLEASLIGEENGICEIKVEVTDNGIGISPEKQPKLFFAFEQAESGTSREYGGTGLGLAISRRIVELMGGLIWVESEIDKGAKFIFTVKAERSDKSSHSMLAPDVNWKNIRIMAVDDDEETLAQFRNIFNQLKIPCDTASGGYEAFRIVEERGVYDIYFIDWLMPGMDGIELTRRIKAMKGGKPSVVTMITAADWESIKGKAIEAGVDKHLLKPLFSSMIIDCVNECLGAEESPVAGCKPDNFKGKTMLLAEDIEINREILISLLEDTEITIDCAENGREALEKIAAEPDKYDVVLMDVQMPQMDGLESTRRIRALPELQNRKLPIIAMTANVFKSDIAACIEAGMDDHLGKPLDIDKVLEKLRKYMSY
jgi:CheY-like chemotaxis protein/anti-sigma regulatory factor (Ser/Thr protein kinase)